MSLGTPWQRLHALRGARGEAIRSARTRLPVRILQFDHQDPRRGLVDVFDLVPFRLEPRHLAHLRFALGLRYAAILVRHLSAEFAEKDVEVARVIVTARSAWAQARPVAVFKHAHHLVFEYHPVA